MLKWKTGEISEALCFKEVVAPREILELLLQDMFLWLKLLSTSGAWGFICCHGSGKKHCSYCIAVSYQH